MRDFPILGKQKGNRLVRKTPESQKKQSIKIVSAWILLALVAMFFIQQRVEYIRSERKVRELMLEKRKLVSEILPLKLEERYLMQLNKVEKIARDQLKLDWPKSYQILLLPKEPVNPPEVVEQTNNDPQNSQ